MSPSQPKVAVLGAAGGIGQPLSLLLKANPLVAELALYDVVNVPGVAADLSHINTPAKVTGHDKDDIASALKNADFVIIPAGVPRKPGMTRDDLFNTNAGIVANLAEQCALHCPTAAFLIISNPVNSTVPIFREVLRKHGKYNAKKLFGVTTLDVVRSNAFVGAELNIVAEVPVIGGHAGTTILPLLSSFKGLKDVPALTKRIQFAGDEVVEAKKGLGSATLSMAYAGAHFLGRLLEANAGKQNVVECCFVESQVVPGFEFFASPVRLGKNGEVQEILPLPKLSEFESKALESMSKDLKAQIEKGVAFGKSKL